MLKKSKLILNRMKSSSTSEDIAEVLFQAELNIVEAERKLTKETDPIKQIEYLQLLTESIKRLEKLNSEI